jgi:hypothetical protein
MELILISRIFQPQWFTSAVLLHFNHLFSLVKTVCAQQQQLTRSFPFYTISFNVLCIWAFQFKRRKDGGDEKSSVVEVRTLLFDFCNFGTNYCGILGNFHKKHSLSWLGLFKIFKFKRKIFISIFLSKFYFLSL